MNSFQRYWTVPLIATLACATTVARAGDDPSFYKQVNLASDGAASTLNTDPQLKNPWGIAAFPGGPFWIADNATGVSTLYNGMGTKAPLTVKIPPPKGSPGGTLAAPTGLVFNSNPFAFLLQAQPALPALFIFSTEDGTISAWNPSVDLTNAVLKADNSAEGAVYKGLAVATNSTGIFLYATNFHDARIDVFNSQFQPAKLSGSFHDPNIPAGYAPFGIALIDGNLFVTYALQKPDKHDDMAGPDHGFVDVYDTDGNLVRRFASHGTLNSPWGIARAPQNFGSFSSQILIGNFGDGRINGFASDGTFHGQLQSTSGHAVQINGLWSIQFGIEAAASPSKLYFTAGTNDEADGTFGLLKVVPGN